MGEAPYCQKKACYAAALSLWRWEMDCAPGFKPLPGAFGLSPEEASLVERQGYPTDGLPEPLRPRRSYPENPT